MSVDRWGPDIVAGNLITWQTGDGSTRQGFAVTCEAAGCRTYLLLGRGCRALHIADAHGRTFARINPDVWAYSPADFWPMWEASLA